MSNILVFGNICKLMTKALHRKIDTRVSWDSSLCLDKDCNGELEFWVTTIPSLNLRHLEAKVQLPTRLLYSDASNTGCAAYISADDSPLFYKNWTEIEARQSSTWRELKCLEHAFQSFRNKLSSHRLKWFTDNQSVVSIVESGSVKLHLHRLAVNIFFCAKENNIALSVEWIPRTMNDRAIISVKL